jgi:hypothetical protein
MFTDCPCCRVTAADFCRCVFAVCPECDRCRTHCICLPPAIDAVLDGLDAPDGPFSQEFTNQRRFTP